jgi:hypothetical protein
MTGYVSERDWPPTQCYVDESVQVAAGFVVSAFVFASGRFDRAVAKALAGAGLKPHRDELKSSARMDTDPKMRAAREAVLALAGSKTRIAVFLGPYKRADLGKHSLQALQSVIVRNGVRPSRLDVYFDKGIFPSAKEAARLHKLFHALRYLRLHPQEDSRQRLGIQVADVVAHSFGQILKEELTGEQKLVDIGGPDTGYAPGEKAPLGWHLLTRLRHSLMTRPAVYRGEPYRPALDPVVLDPVNDDPVVYLLCPVLLGWGVQVSPMASERLREGVQRAFERVWLGCVH